jgi:hypothetical protein
MAFTSRSRVVATEDQVSTAVGGEVVILGMHDGVYYGLDAVGARVWSLLQAPLAVSEIVEVITGEFDVDAPRCERDVLALLEDLKSRGLAREVGARDAGTGA